MLWLNGFDGMDIRCVRIIPYDLEGRVLLDVQQVLPLPEAADYQVRLRRKDAAAREQARSGGRDFTRYHVVVEDVALPHQNKRNAVRTMVEQLAARKVALAEIRATLSNRAIRMLKGIQRDGDAVRDALVAADPGVDLDRWFCDDALVDEATETTYVVSKMWGLHTEPTLASLTAAFPDAGVSFRRAETPDDEQAGSGLKPTHRIAVAALERGRWGGWCGKNGRRRRSSWPDKSPGGQVGQRPASRWWARGLRAKRAKVAKNPATNES